MYIGDNKLLTTIEPKTFHFDLPKNVHNNLKYETDCIIKHKNFLANHTIKIEIIVLI